MFIMNYIHNYSEAVQVHCLSNHMHMMLPEDIIVNDSVLTKTFMHKMCNHHATYIISPIINNHLSIRSDIIIKY